MNESRGAVIVGVDGSRAACAAATWAVAEAHQRGVPIRLVTVIHDATAACWAKDALRLSRAAVENRKLPVPIEEVLLCGETTSALVHESTSASLLCLGSDHRVGGPVEATVATVAQRARCTVAVIRPDGLNGAWVGGVIAVVLDDEPDNDGIVREAMEEGRLRHTTVRQIDRRRDSWVRRFPDVPVELVAAGCGSAGGESRDRRLPQLAVVGQAEADRLGDVVSPNCHPILGYPDCSLLFVRNVVDEASP
jgi:nucleotide-binding universal stress UspA family protein